MPVPTRDIQGHRVVVTGIPISINVDTRQNVKKRHQFIRFGTSLAPNEVNLAFAATPGISLSKNLLISDRSQSISQNSNVFLASSSDEEFFGPTFNSIYKDFLVTDQFSANTPTQRPTPFYYKHSFETPADDVIVTSLTVTDKDFRPVSTTQYKIDLDRRNSEDGRIGDFVYHNLLNTFDEETGESTVYYVRYTLSNGEFFTKILKAEKIFQPATFEDVDTNGNIFEEAQVFLLEQQGNTFLLTLPTQNKYAIRFLANNSRIQVLPPAVGTNEVPWFVRISNGRFFVTDGSATYRYEVAEFSQQIFNPIEPYKIAVEEPALFVSGRILSLGRQNIFHNPSSGFSVDIVHRDREGEIDLGLTTDPAKFDRAISALSTARYREDGGILGIDPLSGMVQTSIDIPQDGELTASFFFKEEQYELTLVNFNPIQNRSVLNGRKVIYVVPEAGPNGNLGQTTSVHILDVDNQGIIQSTTQNGSGGNENLAKITGFDSFGDPIDNPNSIVVNSLVTRPMYYDAIPAVKRNVGVDSNVVGHRFTTTILDNDGNVIDSILFTDRFTVETKFANEKRYLILADIFVADPDSPDSVTLLDTRIRGGGIREDREAELIKRFPEIAWFWDIGSLDGPPFPAAATFIVKLPFKILEEFGGIFTKEQVRDIVSRHVAAGEYPVIRYYGAIPEIVSLTASEETLRVCWTGLGPGFSYNVYYRTTRTSPLVLANSSPITDAGYGELCLTLDDLMDFVPYYVSVTAIDSDGIEGPHSVAWIGMPRLVDHKIKVTIGHVFTVL